MIVRVDAPDIEPRFENFLFIDMPKRRRVSQRNQATLVRASDSSGPPHNLYLWAILNSPIASAYVASRTMRRDNYESYFGEVPLPLTTDAAVQEIVRAAEHYRRIASTRAAVVVQQKTISRSRAPLFELPVEGTSGATESDVRKASLALDAAVLRMSRSARLAQNRKTPQTSQVSAE